MRPRLLAGLVFLLTSAGVRGEDPPKESASPMLSILQELQSLRGEVRELGGRLEVQEHEMDQWREEEQRLYQNLDTRLKGLESRAGVAAPISPSLPAAPPAPEMQEGAPPPAAKAPAPQEAPQQDAQAREASAPGAEAPGDASLAAAPASAAPLDATTEFKNYATAKAILDQGRYLEAARAFEDFISRYPQSASAATAQYWAGSAYFSAGDYPRAIKIQEDLARLHPEHPKAADALLILASAQEKMGRTEEAKSTLRRIVAQYTLSGAAEKAIERLKALTGQKTRPAGP